jgi:ABC-type antimicrobial peptide transport system permease subunit
LRRAVAETDPNAAAFHAVPLAEYTEVATFGQKVAANLMGVLGLMCLLLAAMGLYSVMSYTVSQRIPEIGIRMAMGARPRNVIAMVVGQGMALALAGMAVGTVAAFATTRLVAGMLFRVDASDPATFVLAGLFLSAVALLAAWLPAFRATRIEPMSALRR